MTREVFTGQWLDPRDALIGVGIDTHADDEAPRELLQAAVPGEVRVRVQLVSAEWVRLHQLQVHVSHYLDDQGFWGGFAVALGVDRSSATSRWVCWPPLPTSWPRRFLSSFPLASFSTGTRVTPSRWRKRQPSAASDALLPRRLVIRPVLVDSAVWLRSTALMADVMVSVMPLAGHVTPFLCAVEALIAAGDSVRVYTGAAYVGAFEQLGVEAIPWREASDFDEHHLADVFPQTGRGGPRGLLANPEHVFIRTGTGQTVDLLPRVPATTVGRRPDRLAQRRWRTRSGAHRYPLGDPLGRPALDAEPRSPPPNLPIAPARGPLGRARDRALRVAVAAATGRLRHAYRIVRVQVGLTPHGRRFAEAWFSPFLVMALAVASLEAPRRDLPRHVHFIGAFPPSPRSFPRPDWWTVATTSGAPLVHVTQGTYNTDPNELLRPAFTALASRPVTVIAATGRTAGVPLPFAIPPNTYTSGLLPYDALLPLLTVMITNGGWGGVLAALRYGIPLVIAGGTLDKPVNAAMIARSGAGVDLRTGTPSASAISRALDRISHDPTYRHAALRSRDDLLTHDTGPELVELLHRLSTELRPVRRDHDLWTDAAPPRDPKP